MRSLHALLQSRYTVWLLLALPAVYQTAGYLSGFMVYGEVLGASGDLAAQLLILTMAITPLERMFPGAGWPLWLKRRRRYLGVATFGYALLHLIVYLDDQTGAAAVIADARTVGMWTGWIALLIFLLLAFTSNDTAVRMLRKAWKSLHRWVYAAAALTFLHWLITAYDPGVAVAHLTVLVLLEGYRLWSDMRRMSPVSK